MKLDAVAANTRCPVEETTWSRVRSAVWLWKCPTAQEGSQSFWVSVPVPEAWSVVQRLQRALSMRLLPSAHARTNDIGATARWLPLGGAARFGDLLRGCD